MQVEIFQKLKNEVLFLLQRFSLSAEDRLKVSEVFIFGCLPSENIKVMSGVLQKFLLPTLLLKLKSSLNIKDLKYVSSHLFKLLLSQNKPSKYSSST